MYINTSEKEYRSDPPTRYRIWIFSIKSRLTPHKRVCSHCVQRGLGQFNNSRTRIYPNHTHSFSNKRVLVVHLESFVWSLKFVSKVFWTFPEVCWTFSRRFPKMFLSLLVNYYIIKLDNLVVPSCHAITSFSQVSCKIFWDSCRHVRCLYGAIHMQTHAHTRQTDTHQTQVHTHTHTHACTHTQTQKHISERTRIIHPRTLTPRHAPIQTFSETHTHMLTRARANTRTRTHRATWRQNGRSLHLTRLMAAGPPSTLTSRGIILWRHTQSLLKLLPVNLSRVRAINGRSVTNVCMAYNGGIIGSRPTRCGQLLICPTENERWFCVMNEYEGTFSRFIYNSKTNLKYCNKI